MKQSSMKPNQMRNTVIWQKKENHLHSEQSS